MQPVPAGHVRVAMVAAFDVPIPYLPIDLELMAMWLRGIIKLGMERVDCQDDVRIVAVRDAETVLGDPDLAPLIGPAKPIVNSAPQAMHANGDTPPTQGQQATSSAALRMMARRVAQERRKARLWREQYERLQRDLDCAKRRVASAATFADIYRRETQLVLEYRLGRKFPVGSPEPDCELVLGQNGIIYRRRAIGKPAYVQWVNGNGVPYSWQQLNNDDDQSMVMRELLPLV